MDKLSDKEQLEALRADLGVLLEQWRACLQTVEAIVDEGVTRPGLSPTQRRVAAQSGMMGLRLVESTVTDLDALLTKHMGVL